MTKSELIARLTDKLLEQNNVPAAKEAEMAVKTIIDSMVEGLSKGNRIEIRGFGSFDLNHRSARVGRNPKLGNSVEIPEKWVPHFKAGKALRESVDKAKDK